MATTATTTPSSLGIGSTAAAVAPLGWRRRATQL